MLVSTFGQWYLYPPVSTLQLLYLIGFIIFSSSIFFLLVVYPIGWWRDWNDNPHLKCYQIIFEHMDIWRGWKEHHAKVYWNEMSPRVFTIFATEKRTMMQIKQMLKNHSRWKKLIMFNKNLTSTLKLMKRGQSGVGHLVPPIKAVSFGL